MAVGVPWGLRWALESQAPTVIGSTAAVTQTNPGNSLSITYPGGREVEELGGLRHSGQEHRLVGGDRLLLTGGQQHSGEVVGQGVVGAQVALAGPGLALEIRPSCRSPVSHRCNRLRCDSRKTGSRAPH